MRFRNVDDQKRDLISVLLVELVEGGNLPPEGRSGVTSEYENHWPPLRRESREPYLRTFVELHQRKVGGEIANLQAAGTGLRPQSFKWKDDKCDGSRYPGHEPSKRLGWLAHYLEQRATSKDPQKGERTECSDQSPFHGCKFCVQYLFEHCLNSIPEIQRVKARRYRRTYGTPERHALIRILLPLRTEFTSTMGRI
jgi:hypothetical protein